MTDNTTLQSTELATPPAGLIVATDSIGGVDYQRVKVVWGPDGTATDADTASGSPIPTQLRSSTGIAASFGSGANGTGVQRITVATDDVIIASLATKLDTLHGDAAPLGSGTNGVRIYSGTDDVGPHPGLSANVTVTRPSDTTGYTANDILGPTGGGTSGIDFSIGAVSASNILITSIALERDVAAVISGETSYVMHFYNVTPPSASADNAAFDLPSGDRASYLGNVNIGTPADLGSTLYVETNGINKQVKLAGTHIFAYLVTVGAYTPASASVLKVTINAIQL